MSCPSHFASYCGCGKPSKPSLSKLVCRNGQRLGSKLGEFDERDQVSRRAEHRRSLQSNLMQTETIMHSRQSWRRTEPGHTESVSANRGKNQSACKPGHTELGSPNSGRNRTSGSLTKRRRRCSAPYTCPPRAVAVRILNQRSPQQVPMKRF